VTRKLIPYSIVRPWPEVYSDYVSGTVLLLVGIVGIILVRSKQESNDQR